MIEYYITTGEASAVMTELEMDYIEMAPQEERPWLLWAFLKMKEVDEQGFPTASELSTLHEVTLSLEEALGRELDAVYVGQKYAEGWLELYFYAPTAKKFQSIVTEHASSHYVFDTGSARDAKWEHYRFRLYPDALMLQQIQSRDIIEELREAGDDLSQPREVEHYLQFQTEANAKRAGERLALEGFTFKEITYDSSEEYAHALTLTKEHVIDAPLLGELASTLIAAASKEHGLYAGWSTVLSA
jgi:uncharacterized protein (TIGR01619 family)